MIFERNRRLESSGSKVGYVFSYFLFTTILFLILTVLDKISGTYSYLYTGAITLAITIIGIILKKVIR